jgi:hypothetical protein
VGVHAVEIDERRPVKAPRLAGEIVDEGEGPLGRPVDARRERLEGADVALMWPAMSAQKTSSPASSSGEQSRR